MEIFSPVWPVMRYSPGEDAASFFARALARSRSPADSIQRRRPSLCTLKMLKGGDKDNSWLRHCELNHMADDMSMTLSRVGSNKCRTPSCQAGIENPSVSDG